MFKRSVQMSFRNASGSGRSGKHLNTQALIGWRNDIRQGPGAPKRMLGEVIYSVTDIARRMVRIRLQHTGCKDVLERNLLRGEYIYFSGKDLQVHTARAPELIAMLQCFAYFRIWDNNILRRLTTGLLQLTSFLTTEELAHLMKALSDMEHKDVELLSLLAHRIVTLQDDFTKIQLLSIVQSVVSLDTSNTVLLDALLNSVAKFVVTELSPSALALIMKLLGKRLSLVSDDVLGIFSSTSASSHLENILTPHLDTATKATSSNNSKRNKKRTDDDKNHKKSQRGVKQVLDITAVEKATAMFKHLQLQIIANIQEFSRAGDITAIAAAFSQFVRFGVCSTPHAGGVEGSSSLSDQRQQQQRYAFEHLLRNQFIAVENGASVSDVASMVRTLSNDDDFVKRYLAFFLQHAEACSPSDLADVFQGLKEVALPGVLSLVDVITVPVFASSPGDDEEEKKKKSTLGSITLFQVVKALAAQLELLHKTDAIFSPSVLLRLMGAFGDIFQTTEETLEALTSTTSSPVSTAARVTGTSREKLVVAKQDLTRTCHTISACIIGCSRSFDLKHIAEYFRILAECESVPFTTAATTVLLVAFVAVSR